MSSKAKIHGYDLREIYRGLGAPCRVEASKGKVYEGHLHSIDPQTHTVFLIQLPINSDSQAALLAVRREAISKVDIDFDSKNRVSVEEMDQFMTIPQELDMISTPGLAAERRSKLVKLFKDHRIPVEVKEGESSIRIMDVVIIQSPYDVASVDGSSNVVRDRVRDMVRGWIQQGML